MTRRDFAHRLLVAAVLAPFATSAESSTESGEKELIILEVDGMV